MSMRKRLAPRSGQQEHVTLIVENELPPEQPLYLRRAPPPKQPLFLPDEHYQDFLQGRPRRIRKSWWDGQKCAKGCTGFSVVAILFLLFVGTLMDRQPLYIKGVRPYSAGNGDQNYYVAQQSKRRVVALAPVVSSRARQAAVAYFFTLVISLLYGWGWRIRAMIRRRHYVDIPDASSTLPTFHVPDEAYGAAANGGPNFWNRIKRWRRMQRRKPKRG